MRNGSNPAPRYEFLLGLFLTAFLLAGLIGCDKDEELQWQLVWADEFEGPLGQLPDTNRWQFDVGTDWGNDQLEYDTDRPENVSLTPALDKICKGAIPCIIHRRAYLPGYGPQVKPLVIVVSGVLPKLVKRDQVQIQFFLHYLHVIISCRLWGDHEIDLFKEKMKKTGFSNLIWSYNS